MSDNSSNNKRIARNTIFLYIRMFSQLDLINGDAKYLKYAMIGNNNKWNTLYTNIYPNYDIWGNYMNKVQNLKVWFLKRMDWLNDAIKDNGSISYSLLLNKL